MMILPNIALPSRVGEVISESGMDSREVSEIKNRLDWFQNFPYPIEYRFNRRGFRDHEWPGPNRLNSAIWCLGDSFTLGIGSPFDHIWPQILQQRSKRRTINVSLDGGSNEWIAATAQQILREVAPECIVIMWSYLHRRRGLPDRERKDSLTVGGEAYWQDYYAAIKDPSWPEAPPLREFSRLPEKIRRELKEIHVTDWLLITNNLQVARISDDLERRIHTQITENIEDIDNLRSCVESVKSHQKKTQIIHGIIPKFAPPRYVPEVVTYLQQCWPMIDYFDEPLDWARDRHHFDKKTSEHIVDQLLPLI